MKLEGGTAGLSAHSALPMAGSKRYRKMTVSDAACLTSVREQQHVGEVGSAMFSMLLYRKSMPLLASADPLCQRVTRQHCMFSVCHHAAVPPGRVFLCYVWKHELDSVCLKLRHAVCMVGNVVGDTS